MARKKKKKNIEKWHSDLHLETKQSILAVLSFALAFIFTLAAFGRAGLVGDTSYKIFETLFGKAFFLIPLVFFLAGISFLISIKKRVFGATIIGGIILLLSSLGAIDVILEQEKAAGYIGFLASYPLLKLFDFWATLIILSALILASLLLMLNMPLRKRDKEDEEEDEKTKGMLKGMRKAVSSLKEEIAGIKEKEAEAEEEPLPEEEEIEEEGEEYEEQEEEKEEGKRKIAPVFKFKKRNKNTSRQNLPPLDLLEDNKGKPSAGDIKANANIIKRTLQNFGIEVEMGEINVGPSVTQYTLRPAEGVRLSRITALHNDIALALAAHPIRIEAPIPGRSLVGVEIPNRDIALVGLRSLIGSVEMQESKKALLMALGRDVTGHAIYASIAKMPHLLIAGSTGSGKSVAIHAMMMSLLYRHTPDQLRFLMADPKRVELSAYSGIPHLLTPVVTDAKKIIMVLRWAIKEMEHRYELLSGAGARDVHSYQLKPAAQEEPMPYIVIVIDELADIMVAYPRELEAAIVRLAQMSRAVGIHLVVSTQRPSVEVITGLIKANITSRIAFQVASQVDSRTILDTAGAEKLLGNGDMLYLAGDAGKPKRIQGAFVSEGEVRRVCQYLEEEYSGADFENLNLEEGPSSILEKFEEDDADDDLYEDAKELVIEAGKASASYLQRRLRIGYARAARLLDMLEERGVIGPADGAKAREVYVKQEQEIEKDFDSQEEEAEEIEEGEGEDEVEEVEDDEEKPFFDSMT